MPFFMMNPEQRPCFSSEKQPRLLYVSLWTFANHEKPRTMHRHNDICEVLLTVEGHGVHTIDGETCHTSRGDLLVYNAGVVHEDDSPVGGMERIYCCGVGGLHLPGLPENCLLPRGASARLRTGARFGDFEALYRLIYEQATDPRRHSDEIAARLLPVLLLMVTQLGWEEGDPDRPESAQANQMRGYIDTHYNEELTLEKISDQAGISPYYASHLFKEYCGFSPMQYVMRRRIGEAQSLLLSSEENIAEIAQKTGFESPNHFSTMFNKHTGYAPTAYRKVFRTLRTENEKRNI
ncbi:helix-turn-helix transcriptional regulator [Agathobaculum sp.]|uniref:helix-turn-helix transcriptional regulator n=1 Tax=Agathobaculum sp. TaxID=2048138 RepID=UPI002A83AEE4|nr:AraC family transcriptional regulator [Agathobaculum sp.]MDY3619471.1 AraC family transcriptional regulator [Agathobaculum sp.]